MVCGYDSQTFVIKVSTKLGSFVPVDITPAFVPVGTLETVECLCRTPETVEAPVLYTKREITRHGRARSSYA